MHGVLDDMLAMARCTALATRVPSALWFAYRGREAGYGIAVDRVVVPIIDRVISERAMREHVRDVLRTAGIKSAYLLHAYCVMADVAFDCDLAVLGGAFTRLYDDLMDDSDDSGIDERLTELFRSRPVAAHSDLERLLQDLLRAIGGRLRRSRDDPVYAALRALHGYQILSRSQADEDISAQSLAAITRGKGGFALISLCGLARPGMGRAEQDFLMRLGEALQLLDDYVDVSLDRGSGRVTPMTRGEATLSTVTEMLRGCHAYMRAHYRRSAARPFAGGLYIHLMAGFLKRRAPQRRRAATGRWRKLRSPALIMLSGADGVLPRSGDHAPEVRWTAHYTSDTPDT